MTTERDALRAGPMGPPGPWRLHIEARRSMWCVCGYMATEWASAPDAAKASGCCTKCGRIWDTPLTDVERAALPPHPGDEVCRRCRSW